MPPNNTTSDGYEYGPTLNGKMYFSLLYHRGKGSQKKHMWDIDIVEPDDEYDIFHNSDKHDMYDSNRDYWGVLEKGKAKIGTKGERISKFECPSNETDVWHGYPLFTHEERQGKRNSLPSNFDLLVEQWMKFDLITQELGKKILREKI